MKELIFLGSILFTVNTPVMAQQSHTLTATDHYFTPDTLYISLGDTVNFVSIGYHSATEVDSIDWGNNNLNENGGFDVGFGAPTSDTYFVIGSAGIHYYLCRPHAGMGMKGVIFVDQGTAGVDKDIALGKSKIYQLGNNAYQVHYENSDQYRIYNLQGQLISEGGLDASLNSAVINYNFQNGTYIIAFINDGRQAEKVKFVVAQ